ncbi:MAG: ester cyclase [Marmoricola sp.]
MSLINSEPAETAHRLFQAMETGDRALAAAVVHPDHINYASADQPPANQQAGLAGFLATSAWLRLAFSDLHFDVHETIVDDDRVVAHVTMTGRQTGPFVVCPPGAKPVSFPATGAHFAVAQCHLLTVRDGLVLDHAAVRDDLAMMTQLGHLPPTPRGMARMARWNIGGGAHRAVQKAFDLTAAAATPVLAPTS